MFLLLLNNYLACIQSLQNFYIIVSFLVYKMESRLLFAIDTEDKEELRQLAKKKRISMSSYVRQLLSIKLNEADGFDLKPFPPAISRKEDEKTT